MKKSTVLWLLCGALFAGLGIGLFVSCEKRMPPKFSINIRSERQSYGKISVVPMDGVFFSRGRIVIAPGEENKSYTISGYFDGQVVSMTKNTIITLENAYLENTSGRSALKCETKAEIRTANNSTNYVVSRGRGFAKNAALLGEESLVIGGSGILYVSGKICHALEAERLKIKGSGSVYVEGTRRGSSVNCESFLVEKEKSFSFYVLNSKNGIKADKEISIESGNFYLYDNKTAFKTGISDDSKKKGKIMLLGGTFHMHNNGALYKADGGSFNAAGATFIEEE